MSDSSDRRPSTLGLVGDAISQASRLFSSEIVLAKTELGEKMVSAVAAIASIVGAAAFLIVSLIFLLQAIVDWLVELGWRSSLASLAVGAAIGVAALVAILIATSRLRAWHLAPSRTFNQASRAIAAIKGQK